MSARPLLLLLAVLLVGACSGSEATVTTAGAETTAVSAPPTTAEPAESTPAAAPSTLAPRATTAPTTTVLSVPTTAAVTSVPPTTTAASPTTVVAPSGFAAAVRVVDQAELGASWRPGCPVAVEQLRAIDMSHWDSEGGVREGTLIVHRDHADALVGVFATLYEARFPVHSMRPITDFGADDDASMAANNTSGFNCRMVSGTSTWSQHAYGGAVDINPLVNPWVRGSTVDPPGGAPYVDRSADVPGLIRSGDVVTRAFAAIGWGWGGDWSSTLDYQHFSHNGR